MDKKTLISICAIALIVGFFMTYIKYDGLQFSGYGLIRANGGAVKFLWLLIPISGIALLVSVSQNDTRKGIFNWLPLLTIIFFVIKAYTNLVDQHPFNYKSFSVTDFARVFGNGLWLSIIAGILLAVAVPKNKP